MAVPIGTKIEVEGAQAYKAEMARIIAQSKALDAEMRSLVEQYRDNAAAEEAVTAKTRVLSEQIAKQNEKVALIQGAFSRAAASVGEYAQATEESRKRQRKAADELAQLRAQLDASSKATGEQSRETKELQKAVDAAEKEFTQATAALEKSTRAQAKAETQAADLNRQMLDADTYAKRYERQLDGLADSMDDLEEATDDTGSTLRGVFTGNLLVEGVKSLAGALGDLIDETAEYRKIMASLEVSSEKAGYTAEQTAKSYRTLYGVLGDDQTAATTTANLQALRLAQGDLNGLIQGTIGAWATYGDSIPIDGLSEAINETIRAGQVTGTFADVLNWAGTSEDAFNESLAAANSETERANLVLQELSRQGLMEAGRAWQENNKDIVDANLNTARWQENLAQLAERAAPLFNTITGGLLDVTDAVLELTEDTDFGPLLTGLSAIAGLAATYGVTTKAIQLATSAQQAFNAALASGNVLANLNPIGLAVTAIAAAAAGVGMLWKALDENSRHLNDYTEAALEAYDASVAMHEEAETAAESYWEMVDGWDAQVATMEEAQARLDALQTSQQKNMAAYNTALARRAELQQLINDIQAEMDAGIMGENIDKLKIANDELEEVQGTLDRLRPVLFDTDRRLQALGDTMDGLSGDTSTAYIDASERRRLAILQEARESTEAFTDIYGVASDLFSRIETESELSVQEMIDNLRENQLALENWATNLQILAQRGVDQGLLAELQRMGPEGAKYVAELVTATDAELAELSTLWGNAGTVAAEALVGSIEAKTPAVIAGVQSLVAAANPNVDNFYNVGVNIAQGMIDGMDDWTAAVARASQRLAGAAVAAARGQLEIYSPSHVFRDDIVRDGIIAAYITEMDRGQKDVAAHSAMLAESVQDGAESVRFDSRSFSPYALPAGLTGSVVNNSTNDARSYSIVVNAAEGQSAQEIADEVMQRIQMDVESEAAVWQ